MKIYDLSIFHLTRYKGTIKLSYLQIYYVNKIKKRQQMYITPITVIRHTKNNLVSITNVNKYWIRTSDTLLGSR